MSEQKPIPLIILGMHRSGTSCLAGTLEQAGVYLGAVSDYNKYNKKGNKENDRTMKLNEEILRYNNASWHQAPNTLKWSESHEAEGQALINEFKENCDSRYWGFKDPRVLLTLPFWNKLLPDAKFIGTFRNPQSAAKSLNARANSSIDIDAGLQLWLTYNQRLINFYNQTPFPLISFDLPAEEYHAVLKDICDRFQLTGLTEVDFFDRKLRNQIQEHNQLENHPDIITAYQTLQNYSTKLLT